MESYVPEEAVEAAQKAHVEGRGPAEVAEAAAPAILKQERQRVRETLARLHNDAVRGQIVQEEQHRDSSVESLRVRVLRDVLDSLD